MNDDAASFLYSLEQFGIKVGLDNIRALCAVLGHPERTFTSIHIAGTNGKGSVTAIVDQVLREAGLRVGRYTSPHLTDLAERFVIDGAAVGDDALEDAVLTVRDAITSTAGWCPTFFEVTTAVAFELFRRAGVQLAVCEVGLGGRLDATNILMPAVSAITSIGRDHEQYLGNTIAAIAGEKAGIIKAGVPVVVGALPAEAMAVVRARASSAGAPLIDAANDSQVDRIEANEQITRFDLVTPRRAYGTMTLGLLGRHQIGNAVVGVRVLETIADRFTIDPQAIHRGLAAVRWPGRLQRIAFDDGRTMLLDAAHNPEGAAVLADFLAAAPPRPLVFAAMRDKDVEGILRPLLPLIPAIVITRASNPRSMPPVLLADTVRALSPSITIVTTETPSEALQAAWARDRAIVAAGSIFLLGDLLKEVRRS